MLGARHVGGKTALRSDVPPVIAIPLQQMIRHAVVADEDFGGPVAVNIEHDGIQPVGGRGVGDGVLLKSPIAVVHEQHICKWLQARRTRDHLAAAKLDRRHRRGGEVPVQIPRDKEVDVAIAIDVARRRPG